MLYSLWKNGTKLLMRFTRSDNDEALDVLNRYSLNTKDGTCIVLRDSRGRVISRRLVGFVPYNTSGDNLFEPVHEKFYNNGRVVATLKLGVY